MQMEGNIKGNLLMDNYKGMGRQNMENKELNMLGSLKILRNVEKVNIIMAMAESGKANGKIIGKMEQESIKIVKIKLFKGYGSME